MVTSWHKSWHRAVRFAAALALVQGIHTVLAVPRAEAQIRGVWRFGYGDQIDRLGVINNDFQPDAMREFGGSRVAVGYKYRTLIIGAPIWTWDGEYCVYAGDRYRVIPRAVAAQLLGRPLERVSPPFFYEYPFGLIVLGFLIVVGPPTLFAWDRYQKRQQARARAAFEASLRPSALPVESTNSLL